MTDRSRSGWSAERMPYREPNDSGDVVPVVLASQSPRRRELLALIGIRHEVRPADIDETYLTGEQPRAHAERLARGKAEAIAAPNAVTIGSDTIVVVDSQIRDKSLAEAEVARMLL